MKKDMKHDRIFALPQDQVSEIMNRVTEKYKNDPTFKKNLIIHPTETLKEEGLELQPGLSIQIVKTEEEARQLPDNVIPISFGDKQDSLSLEDLDKVSGGRTEVGSPHPGSYIYDNILGFVPKPK